MEKDSQERMRVLIFRVESFSKSGPPAGKVVQIRELLEEMAAAIAGENVRWQREKELCETLK